LIKPYISDQIAANPTSRRLGSLITAIVITKLLFPSLPSPNADCLTIHLFSSCPVTLLGDREIGNDALATWNAPAKLIPVIYGCFSKLPKPIGCCDTFRI